MSFCNPGTFFIASDHVIKNTKQVGLFYSLCDAPGLLFSDFLYYPEISETRGVNISFL